jgi:hypothetical protein
MHRRARNLAAAPAALLRGRRPDLLLAAQSPHPPLADPMAGGLELVGEEPVPELGVIGVEVDDRVGEMRVVEIAITHRPRQPLVERLRAEAEHPAGQPHRDLLGGQLLDQREHHFGSASLAK